MISVQDPAVQDPHTFSEHSIAARGFFALEQMLFDPKFSDYARGSYSCALTQAITTDLARIAAQTREGWVKGYATTLRTAGEAGNNVFLTDKEGAQALYTNMLAGLEYIHSQRLGRPLGSFEKPRPRRAEARRSTRSLRNIIVSLESLQEMAEMLADGEASETMEAFDATINYAKTLDDQVFENLNETSAKFKLGSLQELVAVVHEAAAAEIGAHLNVGAGFNALDGD
jgi:predicted lipoprotein